MAPLELDALHLQLYEGRSFTDQQSRSLLAELAALRLELAGQRREIAKRAAGALERRLGEVAAYNHGGCPSCREAEARAFLARLKRISDAGTWVQGILRADRRGPRHV